MSRDYYDTFSAQADESNFRNRTLPPIRELFADELSNPVWPGEGQRKHRSTTPSVTTNYLSDMENGSRNAPITPTAVRQRSYSSASHSSAPSFPQSQYVGHDVSGANGHLYGVLRTSGTSGVLTNAIPPSGKPQGILRQTSTISDEPEDMAKKYKCEYCGKRFGMPSHLQIHLRTHTAHRPYTCEISGCDKTFTVRSNLTRHMRTHSKSLDIVRGEDEATLSGSHRYESDSRQADYSSSNRSYYSSSRRQ